MILESPQYSHLSRDGSLEAEGKGRSCKGLHYQNSRCQKVAMLARRFSTALHPQRYPALCACRAVQATRGSSCLFLTPGIFPREPRHKKRANKGSSAPTSFYYTKDITYLQHEPIIKKLREHKAFAKKLSRALGRGEWSSAKSLEANKPTYRLDHIIKERYATPYLLSSLSIHLSLFFFTFELSRTYPISRYPTFIDALRDIDDALCLVSLFASLPSNDRVPSLLIQNCAKLANEWQLYVMNTHSLRKVFLSIKGVYYQAEVQGEKITWLVPYQFTLRVNCFMYSIQLVS